MRGTIRRIWRWLVATPEDRLLASVRHWQRVEWAKGVDGPCWQWPVVKGGK